jgi:hypothetical protein
MPDDNSHVGESDRSRIAGEKEYEVSYLARKHRLTPEQARELIARVGNDRDKLDHLLFGRGFYGRGAWW